MPARWRKRKPKDLKDPVAKQTEWTLLPSRFVQTNLRVHILKRIGEHRRESRPSWYTLVFPIPFVLFGIIAFGMSFTALFHTLTSSDPAPWMEVLLGILFCVLVGSIFLACGLHMLYQAIGEPAIFDKQRNLFWKGRRPPHESEDIRARDGRAKLDWIYALQILAQRRRSGGRKGRRGRVYYYCQINLVLKDGYRILALDTTGRHRVWEQAKELSGFLGVPVWGIAKARPRKPPVPLFNRLYAKYFGK